MFLFGGYDVDSAPSAELWELNLALMHWVRRTPGGHSPECDFSSSSFFGAFEASWLRVAYSARCHHTAALIGSEMWVFGGKVAGVASV